MRPSPSLPCIRQPSSSSSSWLSWPSSSYNHYSYVVLLPLLISILLSHTTTVAVLGLSTQSPVPTPKARPILVGTSDYSNVLFGKLQRAASLYGTNLEQPVSILRTKNNSCGDSDKTLNKCLWSQFCMADYGPDGTMEEDDLLRPLSSWVPLANIENDLLFLDGTVTPTAQTPPSPFKGFANLFQKQTIEPPPPPPAADPKEGPASVALHRNIVACAAERGCAHVYVLAEESTLAAYRELLGQYSGSHGLSSTVVCVGTSARLGNTPGWISGRPQDLEGDMVGPVGICRRGEDSVPDDSGPGAGEREVPPLLVLPTEDASEVVLQIALRTERSPVESPRVVTLYPGATDTEGRDVMEDRPNRSYFTMTGGKQALKSAGTVRSISSWTELLSPLGGKVDGNVAKRPDARR